MEQKYHASITEEQPKAVAEVDKIVIRQLQNMEVTYKSEYWRSMENILVTNKLIIRKILVTKISEIAIASLLLLGWYDATFSSQAQFPKHRQVQPATTEPIASAQKQSSKRNAAAHDTHTSDGILVENEISSEGHGSIFSTLVHALAQRFDWQAGEVPFSISMQNEDTELTENNIQANVIQGQKNTNNLTEAAKYALLSPLNYENILQSIDAKNHSFADQYLPTQPQKTPTQWHFGAYIGVGNTQITTPMLASAAADPFVTFAGSSAGGVLVGVSRGNWYLETSVGYSNTTFTPQKQTEIYAGNINEGYLGNQLVNTQYEQIHVPLYIGRNILKQNRTIVSVKAGISGNFVASNNNQYKQVRFPGAAQPQGDNTTSGSQRSPEYAQAGKGILQGGGTKGNQYLTADIGIRGEYTIGKKRTKLFAEVMHSANMLGTGVGSHDDKLTMTALKVGVIAAL
jgi:hypothetical protein